MENPHSSPLSNEHPLKSQILPKKPPFSKPKPMETSTILGEAF